MGVVHQSRGGLTPASPHLRSEPAIVAQLAEAVLGPRSTVAWTDLVADYDRVREVISRVIPGFEDYNRRVRTRGGFYLPNPAREGRFATPSGKARFKVHPLPDNVLAEGELLMMTVRSHDQYNTTIYGLDDRYRGVRNERRVVFAHPEDLAAQGLREGDLVDIVGSADGGQRVARTFVVVPFDVPRGNCATYFPEANVLVPVHHKAHRSHTPASKAVRVRLRRAEAAGPADPDRVV
jgi:anaerobic selenocysteine-containing dehydrogenase